jgi:hypothetical protein
MSWSAESTSISSSGLRSAIHKAAMAMAGAVLRRSGSTM